MTAGEHWPFKAHPGFLTQGLRGEGSMDPPFGSLSRRKGVGFPDGTVVKKLPASVEASGDRSSIPRSGRGPGRGRSNPPQYSCQVNPTDRGAWQAIVHGVAKNEIRLRDCARRRVQRRPRRERQLP